MKKMLNWMLAAILTISSASVVSSCSNEDTPAWDGKNVCTNYTVEYNFVHPATNSKYFVTKWAVWSLDNKREPVPVYSQTVSGGHSHGNDSQHTGEFSTHFHSRQSQKQEHEQRNGNYCYRIT